jgi:hypothetical protein
MSPELGEYLLSIGLTQTARQRVDEIHAFYRAVCPDEITGVFVTDFITEEGLREYQNLWFFSEHFCMEASGFMSKDWFDMALLKNAVVRWAIKRQDYDFERAGATSRLHLDIALLNNVSGSLSASRENCDYLRDVLIRHIVPNMTR